PGPDGATLAPEPQGVVPPSSGHPQHVAGHEDAWLSPCRLKQGGQSHLLEHVESVVTCGAVRSKRDCDASRPHFSDRRDARAQLEIGAGAVEHLDILSRKE